MSVELINILSALDKISRDLENAESEIEAESDEAAYLGMARFSVDAARDALERATGTV